MAFGFRIVFSLTLAQMQKAFPREHGGPKLANQKQNQADMNHPDTRLVTTQMEPLDMGRHQINQQYATNQITARENRNFPVATFWAPEDKKAAKEFVLRLVKP